MDAAVKKMAATARKNNGVGLDDKVLARFIISELNRPPLPGQRGIRRTIRCIFATPNKVQQ
jgi:hypothetical protein